MKFRITKAEYDALNEHLKVLYVVDGDGYKMPLTDYEDPGELRRARDREKEEARAAKERLATLEAEIETLKSEPARKSGDIKTLEAAWQRKHDETKAAYEARLTAANKRLEDHVLQAKANEFAGAIAARPENVGLILPHVTSRLVFDHETGEVRIKDKTGGRVSAMNFDELRDEYLKTPMFSTVVAASKASGGGAAGQTNGTPGGGAAKKFKDLSEQEKVELFKTNPDEYRRCKMADGQ